MIIRRRKKKYIRSGIDPDEVLLDAFNLPEFDTYQFEGRVEKSIHGHIYIVMGIISMIIFSVFLIQIFNLQILRGSQMSTLSQRNRLAHTVIFAKRGIIYDRNKIELAWNVSGDNQDSVGAYPTYAKRKYTNKDGFGHLLGFINYPKKDAQGNWWREKYVGRAGIEKSMNTILDGTNGSKIIEVDALNKIQSENTIKKPLDGKNVTLSIDSVIQEKLFKTIRDGARKSKFVGASSVIMNVKTGELLAITSYPEYNPQIMTDGANEKAIVAYSKDKNQPFLNRAVLGEYSPGSIVKPFVASAVLAEHLISPYKKILSTGQIRVPDPYNPGKYSIFLDWRRQGWVDMMQAIAVSSNVYFYTVGGGFGGQEGLGISRLDEYAARFGLGVPTGINFATEASGVVPSPAWKRKVFGKDNPWRLGDTYHTAIGQFGFLVTPIQVVRYIAAVANGGALLTPHIIKGEKPQKSMIGILDKDLKFARMGMRLSVTDGVAGEVNLPNIQLAVKTGTAQVGIKNQYMNSWAIGFWPYDNPKYAFAVVFEKGPAGTRYGAVPIMKDFFVWLSKTYPKYAQ